MSGGFFDRLGGWLLEGGTSWLRLMPPEIARRGSMAVFDLANRGLLPGVAVTGPDFHDAGDAFWASGLRVKLPGFGELAHPVGLAAGWCRDGRHLQSVEAMGFSFVEIGSLSFDGQSSPALRIKRDYAARTMSMHNRRAGASGASPSRGGYVEEVAARACEASRSGNAAVAINLEVARDQGAVRAVAGLMGALARLSQRGASASSRTQPVVLSFASEMPSRAAISILEALAAGGALVENPFIWVKIGPGWPKGEFQNFVETTVELGYQGLVAGSWRNVTWPEPAILSGAPAFSASNQLLEWAWAVHKGALPMIGSGGVISGEDAFQKILRGASAVELLSALWLRGPFAARLVCAELHAEVRRFGVRSVADCTGVFYEEF